MNLIYDIKNKNFITTLLSSRNEDSIEDGKYDHTAQRQIKIEAKCRSKSRSMLQRIMQTIKKENAPYREIVINAEALERRVVLLEDGVMEKLEIERMNEKPMIGSIFKGRVQNHEMGLQAIFVDIGGKKNAFLHYWDILPSIIGSKIKITEKVNKLSIKQKDKKQLCDDLNQELPVGSEIILQITKTQIRSKGPRTTTNIAIPGRYLVLTPYSSEYGISRKIESRSERDRLKEIISKLTIPTGMGIIVRTIGAGKKIRYFVRDLHILLNKWNNIFNKIESHTNPCILYQEPNIVERTVRDFLTEEIDRVIVDNFSDYNEMINAINIISPRSKSKLKFFQEAIPIFERFNIEKQIEISSHRKVPLFSGGEIIIEETEALTAIDVNTGGHRVDNDKDSDLITKCNLEAAKELTRQIRLRNIGGLIIVDFIDMKNRKNRKLVFDCLKKEMYKDKAKSYILPISQLGIMQMTRQRQKESIMSEIYTSCPYCNSRGIVKSPRNMSIEIQRRLVSIIRKLYNYSEDRISLKILLHPVNLRRLRNKDELHLLKIESVYGVDLSFLADISYHLENFKIINSKTDTVLG